MRHVFLFNRCRYSHENFLLFASLQNEIDLGENENIKKNLKLVVTDNLKQDVMSIVEKEGSEVNVFIDEYSVQSKQDTEIIN